MFVQILNAHVYQLGRIILFCTCKCVHNLQDMTSGMSQTDDACLTLMPVCNILFCCLFWYTAVSFIILALKFGNRYLLNLLLTCMLWGG